MIGVTLNELKKGGVPAEIAVQSLEGDMYISYAMVDGELQAIVTESGERLRARSIAQMHTMLSDVEISEARLMIDSPYDEMIGIESSRGVVGMPLAW